MGTPQIDLTAGLVQKAPSAGAAPAQGGIDLSAGLVSHSDAGTQPANPYPINEGDKGAVAQVAKTGNSILSLPKNLWHAFTGEPQDELEKASVGILNKIPGVTPQMAMGIHRLIIAPMMKEREIANAYDTIHKSLPADQQEKEKDFTNMDSNLHKANMHHIASMVPLIGPLASDITEHYLQGDKSGAVASLLSNIVAGKATDSLTKGLGKQVSKVAPKTATIAGEEVPVMAGQEKDAAPIAKEVAAEPSAKIAEQQQSAAQKGVKNLASDAANQQLANMGQPTGTAESFGDAAAQTKAAAQPTFKKLDQLSEGAFSTLQNKIKMARAASRRATTVDDMESADAQMKDAQQKVQDLMDKHSDQFQPDELKNAQSAWKDAQVLDNVHGYVEKAFSAPESVAAKSNLVSRTLNGNKLITNLNQMVDKIPAEDLQRVLGPDGLNNLYELGQITSKPEAAASLNTVVQQVANKLAKSGTGAAIGAGVAGKPGAMVGAVADVGKDAVIRAISTNPRVAALTVKALKFATPAKVYGPLIANEIQKAQGDEQQQ